MTARKYCVRERAARAGPHAQAHAVYKRSTSMALVLMLLYRAAAVAPAARSRQHAHFYYTSPTTNRTLSVCVCAKCGSTSVYRSLFGAIAGHAWDRQEAPWVQGFMRWGKDAKGTLPGVTRSSRPAGMHMIVIRDPILRYLSAFRSKVACCPEVKGLPPRPCSEIQSGKYVSQLLDLARYEPPRERRNARCLHLDDFALALRAIHDHGDQASINQHFIPQQLWCPPVLQNSGVLLGNVSELAPALAGLTGYEFAGGRIRVLHTHSTISQIKANPLQATLAGISATARGALCSLSRPEYSAYNLSLPRECAF